MTDRIKELMTQAGTDTSGKWMGVDHAEKFAELIVRECASLIPAQQSHAPDGRPLLKIFEEHFGVDS